MFVETPDSNGFASPPAIGPKSDLVALATDDLDRQIRTLAAEIYAATCRWLELVAEFDRRAGYEGWGFWSCSAWLSWRCGVARRAARDHVRVARRLTELPLIRAAFGRGELSYSKVRALTRVATSENQEQLLELARHATAAQLDRLVRAYTSALDSESADQARRDRYLNWSWDDDGSLLFSGRLPAEDGALVVKALEAAGDELRQQSAGDPEDAAQGGSAEPTADRETRRRTSNADALVAIAETQLAAGLSSRSGGERYQVVLHVDADALSGAEGGGRSKGRASLDGGPGLAPETARRIACDASLVPMLHGDDGRMHAGTRTRTIPPSTRRALRARDGGCRFPGCTNRRFVDAHHLEHWADGGETTLANLVLFCRRHHDLFHDGGYTIEGDPSDRLTFRRPDGTTIADVPPLPPASTARLRARNRRRGTRIGPETCLSLSAGDRIDLDLTVAGLVAARGP